MRSFSPILAMFVGHSCARNGCVEKATRNDAFFQEQALQVARVTKIIDPGTDDTKQLFLQPKTDELRR